jgi:hypothetical protein
MAKMFKLLFDDIDEVKAYVAKVESLLKPKISRAHLLLKQNGANVGLTPTTNSLEVIDEGSTLSANEAAALANCDTAYTDADTTNADYNTAGFLVNAEITDETAAAAGDGAITVVPIGGKAPYTYLWDAAGGNATTATIEELDDGTYVCTVTDADGNESEKSCVVAAGE